MYKVLVGEYIDDEAIARLQKARDVKVDVKVGISREEILEIIHEYDALIVRSVIKVDKELLDKAKNLKIVGRAGNGTDNINIPEATAHGVIVANTPDSNTVSACEIAIGLMIASARNIVAANNFIKSGKWEREIFVGNELFEKTLGIIGLGTVGEGVLKVLTKERESIFEKSRADIEVKYACDLNIDREFSFDFDKSILTNDYKKVLNDPEIKIVVELIGGETIAKKIIIEAFQAKKSVVTANKALIAKFGVELFQIAKEKIGDNSESYDKTEYISW